MSKLNLLIFVVLLAFITPLVLSQQKDCRTDQDCIDKGLLNHFCNQTTGFCQPKEDVQQSPGSGIIVPPTETPEPTTTQSTYVPSKYSCQDSDGGEDIFTKGLTITITDSLTDHCIDKKTINEAVCKPNGVGTEYKQIICPEKYNCEEGRCLEIKGNVTLQVDEQIFGPRTTENPYGRGLDKELNYQSYFVDKTVTEYDPLECKFETKESIDINEISFRVFDSFEKTTIVSKPPSKSVSCNENKCTLKIEPEKFKRGIDLSANIPPEVNKITCEVTFKGEKFTSQPLNIANHLYIFVPIAPPYVDIQNIKNSYEYFLARTQLDHTSAKPIYKKPEDCGNIILNRISEFDKQIDGLSKLREKWSIKLESERKTLNIANQQINDLNKIDLDQLDLDQRKKHERKREVITGIREELAREVDRREKEYSKLLSSFTSIYLLDEYLWSLERDLDVPSEDITSLFRSLPYEIYSNCIPTLMEFFSVENDRIIQTTDNFRAFDKLLGLAWAYATDKYVVTGQRPHTVLAHELGHTYTLCDEYSEFEYLSGNRSFKPKGGCKNIFPACCWREINPNPKVKLINDLENHKYTIKCADSGGFCHYTNDSSSTCESVGAVRIQSLERDSDCEKKEGLKVTCCLSEEKYIEVGNQCHLPTDGIVGLNGQCAGMPLSLDGSPSIINGVLDITSQYRSIMGPQLFTIKIENRGYPESSKGSLYPLTPGIPKAG